MCSIALLSGNYSFNYKCVKMYRNCIGFLNIYFIEYLVISFVSCRFANLNSLLKYSHYGVKINVTW